MGYVVTRRLAKVDLIWEILIIHSDLDNRDNPLITIPAFYLANLRPDSDIIEQ